MGWTNIVILGWEPWSSGYGRQLMFERFKSRRLILDGHFITLICCNQENCIVCLKRMKINAKEAGAGPFFEKYRNFMLIYPNFLIHRYLLCGI